MTGAALRAGPATGPALENRARGARLRREPEWVDWDDERLLDLRFCDLKLSVSGNGLGRRIARLRRELASRGLDFQPHFWLSSEWFTPDGVPGVAIPFYLAHPRLSLLEKSQFLEVEGGTDEWCMRILRHEAGHAIENAFGLRRRRQRVRLFGRSSAAYPKYYSPRPYSRRYVTHLESSYAQSHPDEDFAETFAVWLAPGSDWRRRYAGWPALEKLEYVDALMRELAGRAPRASRRERVDPLRSLTRTLREHYAEERAHHGVDHPRSYDRDLCSLFSAHARDRSRPSAAGFLQSVRRDVRRQVRRWTGIYQYTIDRVLRDMIARCRELGLRLGTSPEQARMEFSILLTVQTLACLQAGRHRIAL